MKITLNKSEVGGTVRAPSSKSLTIRALMCAALSKGASGIVHPLVCQDTAASVQVLGKIGVRVQQEPGLWRITGGSVRPPVGELNCGESATTMRFMIAICSLIPGTHTLVGGPALSRRPVKSLVDALRQLGIKATLGGKTTPPVTIEGGTLKGEQTELPGNISSQFISALMLIAPFTPKGLNIKLTTRMTSASYVLMTLWCLKQFGVNVHHNGMQFVVPRQRYQPARLEIEGDWTSASYFLALGAFSTAGVTVDNLSTASLQGDRAILDILRRMGAVVRLSGNKVSVSKGNLKALHAEFMDCIDLLPTVAVLAALADGRSELTGIGRARIKETDQVAAMKQGLKKFGVDVTEDNDRLIIVGLRTPKKIDESKEEAEKPGLVPPSREPVVVNSYGDHRVAMAFGVFGAVEGGVIVDGAECVAKTYPDFWEILKTVGGIIEKN
jgi:3-phosphoshikimate 1-carboxyvinyltransferase